MTGEVAFFKVQLLMFSFWNSTQCSTKEASKQKKTAETLILNFPVIKSMFHKE